MTNEDLQKIVDEYIDKYMVLNKCIYNTVEYIDICLKEFKEYYDNITPGNEYGELEKDYIERFNKVLKIIKIGLTKEGE